MSSDSLWLWIVLAALVGAGAGAGLCLWRLRQAAKARKRIPRRWPLNPRVLANTEERKVWHWLREVFNDHHVMTKVPVTRFTLPRNRDEGAHWYSLLSGVYCTLTVCNREGQVIGCVDVPGPQGISNSNRQLKRSLLSQCRVPYWVIVSESLPLRAEIRSDFLGETDPEARDREWVDATIAAARAKLRAQVEVQRRRRGDSGPAPLAHANATEDDKQPSGPTLDSQYNSSGAWHLNSFIAPLDSRRGDLA